MGPFFTVHGNHESKWEALRIFRGDASRMSESRQQDVSAAEKKDMSECEKAASEVDRTRVVIKNDVGDLIGALNSGTIIEIFGNTGDYAGEGMLAGELTIEGSAGDFAGHAMSGGTIFIKGNAGNYLGQALKGGTIVVAGSTNGFVGAFMISGVIVICGSAGRHIGRCMIGGTIYLRGRYKTVESDVEVEKLTDVDKKLIREIAEKYQLNLPTKGMKKISAKPNSPI
jgi:glutamate synthase domain-containing protein 3